MSIALLRKLQELERRVEALERSPLEAQRRAVLSTQAAAMRAQGDALRAEVRAILEAHTGVRRLKAYAVLTLLKRDPLPSLRRVQEVMQEIKREHVGTAQHEAATSAAPVFLPDPRCRP
jgi:uncharacterized coiled-coil DUF342 family protein